jgi:hypothetical protein
MLGGKRVSDDSGFRSNRLKEIWANLCGSIFERKLIGAIFDIKMLSKTA